MERMVYYLEWGDHEQISLLSSRNGKRTMKKYHRLLIYVVFAGLTFFFFAALSVTISERFKQHGNRPYGRHVDIRRKEVHDDYMGERGDQPNESADNEIRSLLVRESLQIF